MLNLWSDEQLKREQKLFESKDTFLCEIRQYDKWHEEQKYLQKIQLRKFSIANQKFNLVCKFQIRLFEIIKVNLFWVNHVANNNEKPKRSYKAANECVYGVVAWSTPENGSRQSKNAQFGDIEAAGCRMEITYRMPKTSIHRWSKTIEVTIKHTARHFHLFARLFHLLFIVARGNYCLQCLLYAANNVLSQMKSIV